jgi:hypothetical protein
VHSRGCQMSEFDMDVPAGLDAFRVRDLTLFRREMAPGLLMLLGIHLKHGEAALSSGGL